MCIFTCPGTSIQKVHAIVYFIMDLHVVWEKVWIMISWLQKAADLVLHGFRLSLYMYLVSYCFQKVNICD